MQMWEEVAAMYQVVVEEMKATRGTDEINEEDVAAVARAMKGLLVWNTGVVFARGILWLWSMSTTWAQAQYTAWGTPSLPWTQRQSLSMHTCLASR